MRGDGLNPYCKEGFLNIILRQAHFVKKKRKGHRNMDVLLYILILISFNQRSLILCVWDD